MGQEKPERGRIAVLEVVLFVEPYELVEQEATVHERLQGMLLDLAVHQPVLNPLSELGQERETPEEIALSGALEIGEEIALFAIGASKTDLEAEETRKKSLTFHLEW